MLGVVGTACAVELLEGWRDGGCLRFEQEVLQGALHIAELAQHEAGWEKGRWYWTQRAQWRMDRVAEALTVHAENHDPRPHLIASARRWIVEMILKDRFDVAARLVPLASWQDRQEYNHTLAGRPTLERRMAGIDEPEVDVDQRFERIEQARHRGIVPAERLDRAEAMLMLRAGRWDDMCERLDGIELDTSAVRLLLEAAQVAHLSGAEPRVLTDLARLTRKVKLDEGQGLHFQPRIVAIGIYAGDADEVALRQDGDGGGEEAGPCALGAAYWTGPVLCALVHAGQVDNAAKRFEQLEGPDATRLWEEFAFMVALQYFAEGGAVVEPQADARDDGAPARGRHHGGPLEPVGGRQTLKRLVDDWKRSGPDVKMLIQLLDRGAEVDPDWIYRAVAEEVEWCGGRLPLLATSLIRAGHSDRAVRVLDHLRMPERFAWADDGELLWIMSEAAGWARLSPDAAPLRRWIRGWTRQWFDAWQRGETIIEAVAEPDGAEVDRFEWDDDRRRSHDVATMLDAGPRLAFAAGHLLADAGMFREAEHLHIALVDPDARDGLLAGIEATWSDLWAPAAVEAASEGTCWEPAAWLMQWRARHRMPASNGDGQ